MRASNVGTGKSTSDTAPPLHHGGEDLLDRYRRVIHLDIAVNGSVRHPIPMKVMLLQPAITFNCSATVVRLSSGRSE